MVADAKPAAQIQWFRGNMEYKPGKLFVLYSIYFSIFFFCKSLNNFFKMHSCEGMTKFIYVNNVINYRII